MAITWDQGLGVFVWLSCSFGLTLLFIPQVRQLAIRWGCMVQPRKERWHRRPTPFLGGLAFIGGFVIPAVLFSQNLFNSLSFFFVTGLMGGLGLYDDLYQVSPVTKLIGQLVAAATALSCGYALHFFVWPPLDALLTIAWIVGLTNALNLLDNMDGLAGGIGLIAALFLAVLFFLHGDFQYALLALCLAGAVAGFVCFNFYPASIFMGDAGSLFLGSALSLLAIHAHGQASHILSLVAVPTCLLLVPILDTGLVTVTRLLRGQPVSQGGKDHTSHRLVVLGLTEPKAVLLLYLMATLSGMTALLIERLSYTLSLALVPLMVLACVLFTAYLAQVEIVAEEEGPQRARGRKLPGLFVTLTYKRRLFEIILDFFLIAVTYYLAFLLRFDLQLTDSQLRLYVTSLPLVLIATSCVFICSGIYRGVWRYTDLADLLRFAKGVLGGTLLCVAVLFLFYGFSGYSRVVLILYPLLLFFGMAGSRLSFRFFALLVARPYGEKVPVLVYGAGDGGEVVVRECRNNPRIEYRPLGFLDDDPRKQGRTIQGLPVFGGVDKLQEILGRAKVQGCIISSPSILQNGNGEKIRTLCQESGLWIRQLRLEFVQG